ncbi:pseudouridylate synthase PUS7L-like [Amphiura filiformis]|uniref:pseudouridylate synthase PUS7L-like n=1 Tax=Amphiura filiformis TaxID=82378 RepID=UPI003B20D4AE
MDCTSTLFGIESFISDHCGFAGVIKHDFKDFVVHEIDMHGNMVQLDETYKICAPGIDSVKERVECTLDEDHAVESKATSSKCPQNAFQNEDTCHDSADFKKNKTSHSHQQLLSNSTLTHTTDKLSNQLGVENPNLDEKRTSETTETCKSTYLKRLREVLSDDIVEKIHAFAESEFDFNILRSKDAINDGQIPNGCKNTTFSVGVVSSKEIRAEIHSAIKYVFPHLCTDTQKPSDGSDGLEIIIRTNATYWKLRRFIVADEIDNFMHFVDEKEHSKTFSLTCPDAKEVRTHLHRVIAKHYGSFLESKTFVTSDGSDQDRSHKIVVRFRQKYGGRGQKRKVAEEKTIFSGFVLKKENLEMLDVINKLAATLRVHSSDFSYAGIKDKKAITTQLMCVKGVSTQRLNSHFSKTDVSGIQVGNIHPLQGPIQRGQLRGNHFDIIVRDVKLQKKGVGDIDETQMMVRLEDEVKKAAQNVKTNMFLNYFGQQRFGSISDIQGNAANIGLEILKGNYVQAVKYLLSPIEGKDDAVNKAKKFFQETQDAKTTLSMMPNYKSRECMLLKALHRHGLDHDGYTKALLSIPHSMRQLYVHSYCSLVWNRMATQRIKLYGSQLMEGDLVIPAGVDKAITRDQVQTVTQEDISSRSFTIQDLVLPLPGNAIQYPSNKVGHLYQQSLKQDGLSQNSFRLNSLKLNIPGDYRKLFSCPTDLTYKIYQETSSSLVQTTTQVEVPRTLLVSTTNNSSYQESSSKEDFTSKNKINLRLSFRLPTSSYATMCVREMMKQ